MEEKPKKELPPRTDTETIITSSLTDIKVNKNWVNGGDETKIFSLKFNHDDKFIAAACENGELQVYNVNTGSLAYNFVNQHKTPISAVRWRPRGDRFKTNNVFVTTNSEGEISHYHLASQKCLSTIKDQAPPGENNRDPQLFCLDYNPEGTQFAVAGAKPFINMYDEESKKIVRCLGGDGDYTHPPHSSRIYCVKYDLENPNILYSGGWDMRVIRWDFREGKQNISNNGIVGPLICGDGIDISGNYILTASWKENHQIQIWDNRNMKLVANYNWDQYVKNPNGQGEPCFCYAGQFSKNDGGTIILAGGSGSNEVKMFDRTLGEKDVVGIFDLSREIDCLDFSNGGYKFACAGGDGYVRVFGLNVKL